MNIRELYGRVNDLCKIIVGIVFSLLLSLGKNHQIRFFQLAATNLFEFKVFQQPIFHLID